MTAAAVTILALAYIAFAALANALASSTTRDEDGTPDITAAAIIRTFQLYARAVTRLRVDNPEHIPPHRTGTTTPGQPLIVVVNHTAGIDPVLVQAACNAFEIRWIMAADMRTPRLEPLWTFGKLIFVDRDDPKPDALKQALKHLKRGGCIGIFPEGAIARPPRQLLPFNNGVGFLARASGATVLPAVVEGTPPAPSAWASIGKPANASVTFLEPVTYARKQTPEDIASDLRRRFKDATNWPLAPPQPSPQPNPDQPATAPSPDNR